MPLRIFATLLSSSILSAHDFYKVSFSYLSSLPF